MNEQIENSENDFLWKLLANPADPSHSYVYNLQLVVNDYPQSSLLRALLVPKGDDQHLKHAAAYFTPATLHKMATNLDSLTTVSDEQIVFVEENNYVPRTYVNPMAEPFIPPIIDDNDTNYFHVEDAEAPAVEDADEATTTPESYIEQEQPANEVNEPELVEDEVYDEIAPHDEAPVSISPPARDDVVHEQAEQPVDTEEGVEETYSTEQYPWYIDSHVEEEVATAEPVQAEEEKIDEEEQPVDENLLAKEYEEHLARINAANANMPFYTFDADGEDEDKQESAEEEIDDEVYDEIVSIEDIGLEQLAILDKTVTEEPADNDSTVVVDAEEEATESDYVAFNAEDGDEIQVDVAPVPEVQQPLTVTAPVVIAAASARAQVGSSQKVSRYNDEKMPYSFMWWLDKTRKEHADKYQPYAGGTSGTKPPGAKQDTPQPQNVKPVLADELQQQYFENIFNANSIQALDPLPSQETVAEAPVRKEDKIIERFIQEEPQIKHPSTVKLNSENKAKKSSEDRDELVTETLAKIYTEQMLYHKAINTYKKLMLKYPEKSLYFAGQIEQLENKIN